MKKCLMILGCMSLVGCSTTSKDPTNLEIVTRDVPVPVLCQVEIDRAKFAINQAEAGLILEEQNAILRKTIAEQKAYIVALETGIIGCGGKINP